MFGLCSNESVKRQGRRAFLVILTIENHYLMYMYVELGFRAVARRDNWGGGSAYSYCIFMFAYRKNKSP